MRDADSGRARVQSSETQRHDWQIMKNNKDKDKNKTDKIRS